MMVGDWDTLKVKKRQEKGGERRSTDFLQSLFPVCTNFFHYWPEPVPYLELFWPEPVKKSPCRWLGPVCKYLSVTRLYLRQWFFYNSAALRVPCFNCTMFSLFYIYLLCIVPHLLWCYRILFWLWTLPLVDCTHFQLRNCIHRLLL